MSDDLRIIVNRLERLERQRSAVLVLGALLFLIGVGSVVLSCRVSRASLSQGEIRAEKIVLVEEGSGQEQAELSVRDHEPVLVLRSATGSLAKLTPDTLGFLDEEAHTRVALSFKGGPILAFWEKGKKLVLSLETAGMLLRDQEGRLRASLACAEGGVRLILLDTKEQPRLMLLAPDGGESHIQINDSNGKGVWAPP